MKENVNAKGKPLTRKEKREKEAKEIKNPFKEILKVIKHFFPDLIKQLKEIRDERNKSYVTYETSLILMMRLLGAVMGIKSMRNLTEKFNKKECISNFQKIFSDISIEELPHYDTINNFLSRLKPEELKKIQYALIKKLIRMKCFNTCRYKKLWLISIDGSGMYVFDKRHCDHCLTKTYKKGTPQEYTKYFHYVLEAKLTVGDMVFSICHEFIENEENLEEIPDTEFTQKKKQDCELKGFYNRLSKTLKREFARLPVCLLLDSLYANKEVFNICKENNWEYMIRFKAGSIPTVAEEFETLAKYSAKSADYKDDEYRYVNEIDYEGYKLNVVEYKESSKTKTTTFTYITSPKLKISDENKAEIVSVGRQRWKIENHGFNEQKNHGYELEHPFSHNYTAMKNHYMLIQIAHMIRQLFENGIKILKEHKKSLANISDELLEAFRTIELTTYDMEAIEKKCQIRFIL